VDQTGAQVLPIWARPCPELLAEGGLREQAKERKDGCLKKELHGQ